MSLDLLSGERPTTEPVAPPAQAQPKQDIDLLFGESPSAASETPFAEDDTPRTADKTMVAGFENLNILSSEPPSAESVAPVGPTQPNKEFDLLGDGTQTTSTETQSSEVKTPVTENETPVPADKTPKLVVGGVQSKNVDQYLEGQILMRSSLTSFLSKDWKEMFWLQSGPTTLLVFRSRQDMMDWKIFSKQAASPPPEIREKLDNLAKLKLDFYSKIARKKCKAYSLSEVHSKRYTGALMYTFKLDALKIAGPVHVAAFASREKREAEILHKILEDLYAEAIQLLGAS